MSKDIPIKIVTDSACDLPPGLIEAHHVHVVPLVVYLDGEELAGPFPAPEAFWEEVAARQARPRTAAPAPGTVVEVVQPLVDAGYHVVALTLSSRLSAVYRAFDMAAQTLRERMTVFDTQSLSLGQGVQVLEAARLVAAGTPLDDLLSALANFRSRVHLHAVLDTLDWAERGGRIAHLLPLIRRTTRLFNVKVLLNVAGGDVHFMGAVRSYRAALERLKRQTLSLAPVTQLLIPHTRRHALADALADELAPILGIPREEVLVQEAGPILSAHTGPGALGTVVVRA